MADESSGSYSNIEGANAKEFVVTAECFNKYVRCVVTNIDQTTIESDGTNITQAGDIEVSNITYTGNSKETALANGGDLVA